MSSLKVDNITGRGSTGFTGSVKSEGGSTTTDLQQGLAKAWANYPASGTTFNDSFNASGAVDNGTGNYTISYTNNFSNANNTPQMSSTDVTEVGAESQADITASSVKVRTHNSEGSVRDRDYVGLTVFGDLA